MPWTPTQIHSIIMDHAHEGHALCPSCHVPLMSRQEHTTRYTRPITILYCPICWTDTHLVVPPMEAPVVTMM